MPLACHYQYLAPFSPQFCSQKVMLPEQGAKPCIKCSCAKQVFGGVQKCKSGFRSQAGFMAQGLSIMQYTRQQVQPAWCKILEGAGNVNTPANSCRYQTAAHADPIATSVWRQRQQNNIDAAAWQLRLLACTTPLHCTTSQLVISLLHKHR